MKRIKRSKGTNWDRQKGCPDTLTDAADKAGAHARLCELVKHLPSDFGSKPGQRNREEEWGPDCSCGCRHFAVLAGPLGADWGVCMNKRSPRAGLLTFEHMGCKHFKAAK